MTQTHHAATDIAAAVAAPSMAGTVERRIVSLAANEIGCAGAGITGLTAAGRLTVAASTDEPMSSVAAELADSTGESLTGTVLTDRMDVVCNDLAADRRWPHYGPRLTECTPVRSAACFYVALDGVPLGVIGFYADTTNFFTASVVEECAAFDLLRIQSTNSNRKLHRVAADVTRRHRLALASRTCDPSTPATPRPIPAPKRR